MDMHTLHVEHAALLGLFTLLTIVNSSLHRGGNGSRWFPAFTFSAFLGAMLISLRGSVPDAISIFCGDCFFSLSYVFLHRSLMEFFALRSRRWWLQLGLAAICHLVLLEWGLLRPDTPRRLLWYSLLLGLQVAVIATVTLGNAVGAMRNSVWMMRLLLVLLSTNNFFRALAVGLRGAPRDYLQGGTTLSWALLITTVLQGAITIAFVWLTAARLHGELESEATTDPLTRLLNRRAIETAAHREIARHNKHRLPLCAVLIDLDGFKAVNDLWGHQSGDLLLLEVASCLKDKMRAGDRLARLGGDEFAVLLPGTSLGEALPIAERLRNSIEDLRCEARGQVLAVKASFGVAEINQAGEDWESLLQQCDRALYGVKARGGNQVLVSQ